MGEGKELPAPLLPFWEKGVGDIDALVAPKEEPE
jgi:hypothetical protein